MTETLRPDDPAETSASVAARLESHDWRAPFLLACQPRGHAWLRRQRAGGLPAAVSKAVVAGYYAGRGAVHADWGAGAEAYFGTLAAAFAPETIWATFGNTEALRIARRLSEKCACPWVADIKDYWSSFIPGGFGTVVARRHRGASAMTALSEGHCRDIEPYLPGVPIVIRSGIPESFLQTAESAVDPNRVALAGAVYDENALARIVDGIVSWAVDGAEHETIVDYAGDQGAAVVSAAAKYGGKISVVDHGFVPLDDLHRIQTRAAANIFVRSGPGWFQHKIVELIAAGRPIVGLPASAGETESLCAAARVPFYNCETSEDVSRALSRIREAGEIHPDREVIAGFTWDRSAEALERVLQSTIR